MIRANWPYVAWYAPAHLPRGIVFDSKWRSRMDIDLRGGRGEIMERVTAAIRRYTALRTTVVRGEGEAVLRHVHPADDAVAEFRTCEAEPPPDSLCNVRLLSLGGDLHRVQVAHGLLDGWATAELRREFDGRSRALDLHDRLTAEESSPEGVARSDRAITAVVERSRRAVAALGRYPDPIWPDGPNASFVLRSSELATVIRTLSSSLGVSRAAAAFTLSCLALSAVTGQPAVWTAVLAANRRTRDELRHIGLMMCRGSAFVDIKADQTVAELAAGCGRELWAASRECRYDSAALRTAAIAADTPAQSVVDFHFRESGSEAVRTEAPERAEEAAQGAWRAGFSTGGFALQIGVHLLPDAAVVVLTTDTTFLDDPGVESLGRLLAGPARWALPPDRRVGAAIERGRAG
ncbi:hypothetical protein SAMN05444920_115179 [Nonomuraea solani]|uniref:Condensation domain-containing protein n=1 Tax=Nonomuraea solani TaxID=1144553 RepID=A0A1H6EQR0_9ACTN|nr:hypothetical protein [Nonomuraea solani]SEH00200.1 hypothetical protein SAMN05444920_115179 [Nonomuraea solani]